MKMRRIRPPFFKIYLFKGIKNASTEGGVAGFEKIKASILEKSVLGRMIGQFMGFVPK
jgi:hypothetical protein